MDTLEQNGIYRHENAAIADLLHAQVGKTIRSIRIARDKRGQSGTTITFTDGSYIFIQSEEDIYIAYARPDDPDFLLQAHICNPQYNEDMPHSSDPDIVLE